MIIAFIGVTYWSLLPKMEITIKDATCNLTMFYRILRVFTDIKDVDGAYWSLLPELQFYLLIFLVFITKQINRIKWVGLIWLILILVENYVTHIKFLGLFIDLQFGSFFIAGLLFYKMAIEKENSIFNHLYV
jgi:peptidoglycan/LPS O-acetylase OafA/YrhL